MNATETKHTPGPWRVGDPTNGEPGGGIVAGEVAETARGKSVRYIAKVQGSLNEEWRANAALICAAPDLLEIAKKLFPHVSDEAASAMAGPWWRTMEKQMLAAIAKATVA
jgi:hypothetical protein